MALVSIISGSCLRRLILVFYPRHTGVKGNERADNLTEKAIIDNNHTLDPATVAVCYPAAGKFQTRIHILDSLLLKDKGVQLRGSTCDGARGRMWIVELFRLPGSLQRHLILNK